MSKTAYFAIRNIRRRVEAGLSPFKKKLVARHSKGHGLISISNKGTCYDDDYFLWHQYTVDLNKVHLYKGE